MINVFKNWVEQYFSEREVVMLWLFILIIAVILLLFGNMLAPVLASIVIAYLLQGLVARLERYHVSHGLAVISVYSVFLSIVIIALLVLLPLLWRQLSNLINELPNTLGHGQAMLMALPKRYPHYISPAQMQQLLVEVRAELARFGQVIISASVTSIPSIIAVVIYLVLVPLLVYFFLMDRRRITVWLKVFLPAQRRLIVQVWLEVYAQIGNYVRGKILEMSLVWATCYIAFMFLGLQYAMLLGALVGISVIIPYIGAVVVTVPVLVIGFLQWGWGTPFISLLITYSIIIALDANILVPLLFSEAVNLHPVAIIIAILIFGGLLGFWGVFFAIPLATVVKAVLDAVSKQERNAVPAARLPDSVL